MSFVILILLVVFVFAPIARALAGRISGGGGAHALPAGTEETARLREEVDRLGAEVARLSEEQGFMLRLLAPGDGTPSPGPSPQGGGENGEAEVQAR